MFLTYLSGEGLINLSAGYFESELYGLLSLKFRYSKKASKVEKNHPMFRHSITNIKKQNRRFLKKMCGLLRGSELYIQGGQNLAWFYRKN